MFVRQKKNKSASISVQIISKPYGKYTVLQSLGNSIDQKTILNLVLKAKQEIRRLESTPSLFVLEKDTLIESFLNEVENAQIHRLNALK